MCFNGEVWTLSPQVLGTPTREEIKCMNPNYTDFKFPQIKAHPWHKVIKLPIIVGHFSMDLIMSIILLCIFNLLTR